MTGPIDLVPRLEFWLAEEDGARLSERVIDAVIEETATMGQERHRATSGTRWQRRFAFATAGLAGGILLGLALYRFIVPPVGFPSPSPLPSSAEPSPTTVPTPTPSPMPTPSPFVSVELGYSALPPLADQGWGGFLYAPIDSGGSVHTFPDGKFVGGDVWADFILVSVGSAESGAVVGVNFQATPVPSPGETPGNPDWEHATYARVWAATSAELAAAYVAAAGGEVGDTTTLGGEPAVTIRGANEMAEVVVCVHAGRAYVLSTTAFLRREAAPGWKAFLASFAFLD